MIDVYLILAGFGIGVAIAAPGGPVNILCVQRTLADGFGAGLAIGCGALLGDTLLAIAAASGLSVISTFLDTFSTQIQVIGGLVLVLFGLRLSNGNGACRTTAGDEIGRVMPATASSGLGAHLRTIPGSFLLTVTNPGAILGVFALFGGLASLRGSVPTAADAVVVVVAFAAGNLLWWVTLSSLAAKFRHRVCTGRLVTVNRIAGVALMVFGGAMLLRGTVAFDIAALSIAAFAQA